MALESATHRLTVVTLVFCAGVITTYLVSTWLLDESSTAFESWYPNRETSSATTTRPMLVLLGGGNSSTQKNESSDAALLIDNPLGLSSAKIPNVAACNQCFLCHRNKPDAPSKDENFPDAFAAHEVFPLDSQKIWRRVPNNESFALYRRENREAASNCTECFGCQHELLPVNMETTMLNKTVTMEIGGTAAWVFRVEKGPMVRRAPSGVAYVKVWCLPLMKRVDVAFTPCSTYDALLYARNLLGLDQLVVDCGFDTMVTRAWKGRVDGVVPGTGVIVDWDGIWFDAADGVSLSKHLATGSLELFNKLNATEVILAALFDLLTFQNDRHSQNVFINEDAKITLIDNERVFHESGRTSSIFLPTTHKNAIIHVGNSYIEKKADRRKKPSLEAMLDYRCYAPGGVIGTKYPPKLTQCMEAITKMSQEEIVAKYQLPSRKSSKVLKKRASDMLHQGFEWTLENSNGDPGLRFPWYPTCCKFEKGGKCLDDWKIEDYLE